MKDIEEFLTENRPAVQDDPTFLLETGRRLKAVEGIKSEVDRQRRYGRIMLIITLVAGLVIGVMVTLCAFLFPLDLSSVGDGVWDNVHAFIYRWRQYLVFPVALIAIVLGLVLSSGRKGAVRL